MRALTRLAALAATLAAATACGNADRAADTAAADGAQLVVAGELTPRSLIFGDPARIRGRLSPDGVRVSWLAPHGGALNLWVAPAESPDAARPITETTGRGIEFYEWARNSTHLIYLEPLEDAEHARVFSVNVATGERIDLTPGGPATRSGLVGSSWDYPDEVVIAANDRDPEAIDIYRVNIVTGESRRIYENTDGLAHFHVDSNLEIRLAERVLPDGGRTVMRRTRSGDWETFYDIAFEDAEQSWILCFDGTSRAIYALDSSGSDAARLVRIDLQSGVREIVGAVNGADISNVLFHPVTGEADAFAVNRLNMEWVPLTARGAAAISFLDDNLEGEYHVLSRTVDDRRWIVYTSDAGNPGAYFVFDREAETLTHLLDVRPQLAAREPLRRTAVVIPSRDGLELISYLTLPEGADEDGDGRPEHASPTVIILPDGYGHRFSGEYEPFQDWLSDRGYAVLAVNARGAWGFGKTFLNAGAGALGGAALNDLEDAADWAVARGVAEPGRIGLAGSSLGGVAMLGALARDPDRFACATTLGAPMDLARFVEDTPPYWRSYQPWFVRFIGDPSTPEGRERLDAASPLTHADEISRPVLIAHGAEDPRAQADLAREFTESIVARGAQATFLTMDDEGTKLLRASNRIALHAVAEQFLAGCLGGEAAPIGSDLRGSSIEAPVGAEFIPGLEDALAGRVVAER